MFWWRNSNPDVNRESRISQMGNIEYFFIIWKSFRWLRELELIAKGKWSYGFNKKEVYIFGIPELGCDSILDKAIKYFDLDGPIWARCRACSCYCSCHLQLFGSNKSLILILICKSAPPFNTKGIGFFEFAMLPIILCILFWAAFD